MNEMSSWISICNQMDPQHFTELDCRSYIDQLSCSDRLQCEEALVHIKDAVIGSNRQKACVISHGIVPKLLDKMCDPEEQINIRLNALIVIGSLAKGTVEQVRSLITDYDIVRVLISHVLVPNADQRIVEHCLSALRSVYQYSFAPTELLYGNNTTLSYLMGLACPKSSTQIQICVTSILVPLCSTYSEQVLLCQAGAIPFLARMISSRYSDLQIPALRCLACMCFTNRCVSDNVCVTSYGGKSLPDILSSLLSRVRNPEIQLTAARCLTYIQRSGTLPPTDYRIVYRTLPCLARLCTDDFDQYTRASAAETLAYLAEIDSPLQRLAAICNHLIKSLSELLQSHLALLKQAAFRCFASLGANDEDIRKKIIETKGLMERVLEGLGDPSSQVSLAAVRCLHSLSRSVQQLRTTFQDHSVWKPLMGLISGQPSNELLTVVTSTICNLLLEFSPAKEPMLDSGVVEMLCLLTKNSDPALRLNGSWALMNMAFQAEQHVKTKIINSLGTDRILELLNDTDTRVIMKTLGLLRNLLSKSLHIDDIMSEYSTEVMQAVNMVLDSQHTSELKEQALCIVGNIAAGAQIKDYIIDDDSVLHRLNSFLSHKDSRLQAGSLFAIGNLVHRKDSHSRERYIKLSEVGIISNLQELLRDVSEGTETSDEIQNLLKHLQFS